MWRLTFLLISHLISSALAFLRVVCVYDCPSRSRCYVPSSRTRVHQGNNSSAFETDDDNEEEGVKAYGRRSLSWTKKYRQLVPYEYARATAMKLGLRSKDEWDDYLADGKVYHGPYIPSRPNEMYAEEWVSWEEFLGVMRTLEESMALVRMLNIQSELEYRNFVSMDTRRAEGLRIPAEPEIFYRDKGWFSWDHFLGFDTGDYRCSM